MDLLGPSKSCSAQVTGEVTYNGRPLREFQVHRTAASAGQRDAHIPLLTVRETLDFAARCQGAGSRPSAWAPAESCTYIRCMERYQRLHCRHACATAV